MPSTSDILAAASAAECPVTAVTVMRAMEVTGCYPDIDFKLRADPLGRLVFEADGLFVRCAPERIEAASLEGGEHDGADWRMAVEAWLMARRHRRGE